MMEITGVLAAKPSPSEPAAPIAGVGLALGIAIGAGLTAVAASLIARIRRVRRLGGAGRDGPSQFDDRALGELGDFTFAFDLRDPKTIECDDRARAFLGYPLDPDSRGERRGLEDWMHADDLVKFREASAVLEATETRRIADWDFRCLGADGSWRWLRATHLLTERDAEGRAIRRRGFAIDVTRLKTEERERSIAERRFRRISEIFPGALCRCRLRTDGDLSFECLSPSVGRLFGHEPEQLLADPSLIWRKAVPEDLDRMRLTIAESAKNRWPWDGVFRLRDADGRVRWLRLWLTPEPPRLDPLNDSEPDPEDSRGGPLWNGVLIDDSLRLDAEAETAQVANLAIHSPDGWARLDGDLRPIWINRTLRSFSGLGAEEPIPGDLLDRICPDWTRRLIDEEGLPQLTERGEWMGEASLRKPDGSEVPVSLLWTAKRSAPGERIEEFSVAIRDSSRRKRLDLELLETIERLETASRSKDRFLAGMGRAIREPLFSAIGGLNLMKMLEAADQRETVLALVDRNANLIRNALDHLLDFARLRQAGEDFELQPAAPWALVREIIAEFADQQRAAASGLTVKASAKTPLPRRIRTDPERFRQAVARSLAWSAIRWRRAHDAPFPRQSAPSITVWTGLETGGGALEFRTRAGSEIEPQYQLRVDISAPLGAGDHWEVPLLAGSLNLDDPALADHCQDDGFELVLARAAAEALGGSIAWSEAESRLTIHLPISAEDASALEACKEIDSRETPLSESQERGNAGHVLLVEDNPDHRKILSHYLETAGFRIDAASNGREGTEKALAQAFDAILMDIDLPVINGREAARLLRVNGVATPVLAMTASALPEERQRCLNAGCVDCLVKPVSRDALIRALTDAIRPFGARASAVSNAAPRVAQPRAADLNSVSAFTNSPLPVETEGATDLEIAVFDPRSSHDEPAGGPALDETRRHGGNDLDPRSEMDPMLAEEPMEESYGFDLDDELWQDPEFQEMVREFARSLPSRLIEVKQAWEREETDIIESIAHQLKGAGGMFGHPRLSRVAAKIVSGARDFLDHRSLGVLIAELEAAVEEAVIRTSQNNFQAHP